MPSTMISRIDGLTTSVAVKAPIKIMATAPLTLFGEQTVNSTYPDGSAVSAVVLDGDRVGVNGQADQTQNGIYVARTTAWTRAKDFDGALDAVLGTLVTDSIPVIWRLTTPLPVLFGTSNITFETEDGFNQGNLNDLASPDGWMMVGAGAHGTVKNAIEDVETDISDLSTDVNARLLNTLSSLSTPDGSGRGVPNANNYVHYDLDLTKRPKPSGMSWLPFEVLGFRPSGKLAISKTAEQVFDSIITLPTLLSEGYVDVGGGSDANNGSIAQPWASIAFAVTQAAYVTKVAVGTYGPFATLLRSATSGNRARRIRGSGNPLAATTIDTTKNTIIRATGDSLSAATWAVSASPAVNTTTLSTGNGVVAITLSNRLDEFGRPLPLTQRASATDVAALGGWYYDTATKLLSIRYGTTANFNASVKPNLQAIYNDATTNGYLVCQGAEVYFENILFVGCFPQAITSSGAPAKLVFKNCGFWFARVSAIINQGSFVELEDCEIYRCQGDGVNSHSYLGLEADHIVINTDMNYCGDFDTVGGSGDNNQNGASMHENGRSFVGGSRIYKSSGPGLIDTGSGPGSTGVSWWIGNHSGNSLSTNPANYDTYGVRKVWIESCSETGDGVVPVRSSDVGTVLRYGPNAVRGYTPTSSGETVAYDPLNPL